MEAIKKFWQDEAGVSAVEYALLVAIIAVAIITALTTFKDKITGVFDRAGAELDKVTPGGT